MCTSLILKPIFLVGMALAIALTAVSLFTPGWSSYTSTDGKKVHVGLITHNCGSNGTESTDSIYEACKAYVDSRPGWEKAVIVLMAIALVVELVVFAWSMLTCLACCLPGCFSLETLLTGVACGCLVASVAIYGSKNSYANITLTTNVTKDWDKVLGLSYSFWLAAAAAAITALLALLSAITALLSSVLPF